MSEGNTKSKFPYVSIESIPRHTKSFACLSLKFGCVLSAITIILYSVFGIAQCAAALGVIPAQLRAGDLATMMAYGMVIGVTISHAVTLFLSTLMLVGALSEKLYLIRPWVIWVSIQVTVSVLLFVFWTTMNMINHFTEDSLVFYAVEFLIILVRIYMLTIVSSFYRQLVEERGETERLVNMLNNDSWYSV